MRKKSTLCIRRSFKKTLALSLTLIALSVTADGQPYKNGVGLRAGYSSGFTFKHFLKWETALEAQALYNRHGFQFTALYEYQFSPYAKERLFYYGGAGPFGGNWENKPSLGIALNLGSEFVFRKAPVVVGAEWKPMLNIYKNTALDLLDFALTAKVTLK